MPKRNDVYRVEYYRDKLWSVYCNKHEVFLGTISECKDYIELAKGGYI